MRGESVFWVAQLKNVYFCLVRSGELSLDCYTGDFHIGYSNYGIFSVSSLSMPLEHA